MRWRRFGVMLLMSMAAGATLVTATAQGAVPVQFHISGMRFTVTATELTAKGGFEQFATLDKKYVYNDDGRKTGETEEVVIVSALQDVELSNLCQSIDLGGVYLRLTAGTGKDKVTADAMVTHSDDLAGKASFNNINIGVDAATLSSVKMNGKAVTGAPATLGQEADVFKIEKLRQRNYFTTAAAFKLPGMHMSFSQADCP